MKRTTLTPEQAAWLDETVTRNRALYAGWSMNGNDSGGDDDDSGDDGDDDSGDDDGGDDDSGDDDGDDWKAKFEAQQRINRNLERRTRKDAQRIKQLEGGDTKKGGKASGGKDGDDDKVDADEIRQQAKAEAAQEILHERVQDKIEAKAGAFASPRLAVLAVLDGRDIDDFLGDDNKIDVEAITDALKELGEKQPNLLAQGGRFQGGADGGARKGSGQGRPKSLGEAIARRYDDKR